MWLDARHDITVRQFVTCAELDWLRKATLRHHSRLAARVAQALNLNVDLIEDVNSVDGASMLLPSTSCVTRDIMLTGGLTGYSVVYTCSAAILESCKSGIIFDCFARKASGYSWALEIQDPTASLAMSSRLQAKTWGSQRILCATTSFFLPATKPIL